MTSATLWLDAVNLQMLKERGFAIFDDYVEDSPLHADPISLATAYSESAAAAASVSVSASSKPIAPPPAATKSGFGSGGGSGSNKRRRAASPEPPAAAAPPPPPVAVIDPLTAINDLRTAALSAAGGGSGNGSSDGAANGEADPTEFDYDISTANELLYRHAQSELPFDERDAVLPPDLPIEAAIACAIGGGVIPSAATTTATEAKAESGAPPNADASRQLIRQSIAAQLKRCGVDATESQVLTALTEVVSEYVFSLVTSGADTNLTPAPTAPTRSVSVIAATSKSATKRFQWVVRTERILQSGIQRLRSRHAASPATTNTTATTTTANGAVNGSGESATASVNPKARAPPSVAPLTIGLADYLKSIRSGAN